MEAMLQLMMAKFDGVADAVQNIGMWVDAIERRESLPALEGAREETKIGQATVDPVAMAARERNGGAAAEGWSAVAGQLLATTRLQANLGTAAASGAYSVCYCQAPCASIGDFVPPHREGGSEKVKAALRGSSG